MASIIFNVGGSDNTLELDTRATFFQPFIATNWTDLRWTIACSLTAQSANDSQSGLAEVYPSTGDGNHAYIGFKTSDGLLPPSTNFWGLSSNQILVPSATAQLYDQGPGNYLQLGNSNTISAALLLSNPTTKQNSSIGVASGPRFFEGALPSANYSQLIMIRMRRNDPTLSVVNTLEVVINSNAVDNGLTFLSNTTVANIRAITAAATFTTILGPFTFTSVPDAMFIYWPFTKSRFRVHDYVLEKYA